MLTLNKYLYIILGQMVMICKFIWMQNYLLCTYNNLHQKVVSAWFISFNQIFNIFFEITSSNFYNIILCRMGSASNNGINQKYQILQLCLFGAKPYMIPCVHCTSHLPNITLLQYWVVDSFDISLCNIYNDMCTVLHIFNSMIGKYLVLQVEPPAT